MNTVVIALLGMVGIIASPAILAYITGRQRRAEKLEDYARQDLVADRVTDAADKAADVAKQAAEAARLLVASNALAAEAAVQTAAVTNGKLDQIHTLVNSNMDVALRAELGSKEEVLVMLREVMAVNTTAGRLPSPEALERIAATERKIAELRAVLTDRLAQTQIAQQQVEGKRP